MQGPSPASNPLQNKWAVLYVVPDEPNCAQLIRHYGTFPEIHIQPVDQLGQNIPQWLVEVPTLATLHDRSVYRGMQAIQLLQQFVEAKMNHSKGGQGGQGGQGFQGAIMNDRRPPSQVGGVPPPNQGMMAMGGVPPSADPTLGNRLQPVVVTGGFSGCTLDTAFLSSQPPVEEEVRDSRMGQSKSNKVSQGDVDGYMRRRESVARPMAPQSMQQ